MKQEYRYAVLHVRTGDSTEGTAKEVAKFVGCTPSTIRNYGRMKEKLYQKTWKIEMLSRLQTEYDDCNSLSESDLQKWDNFINSIKKSRRKKSYFRTPQKVR